MGVLKNLKTVLATGGGVLVLILVAVWISSWSGSSIIQQDGLDGESNYDSESDIEERYLNVHEARRAPFLEATYDIDAITSCPIKASEDQLQILSFDPGVKDLLIPRTANVDYDIQVVSDVLCESGVKVSYSFLEKEEGWWMFDISHPYYNSDHPISWERYRYFNIVLKSEKSTNHLMILIGEHAGDWWDFINTRQFEANTWYLVSIPFSSFRKSLEDMSTPLVGDGMFSREWLNEYRILFHNDILEGNPMENVVWVDEVFLS